MSNSRSVSRPVDRPHPRPDGTRPTSAEEGCEPIRRGSRSVECAARQPVLGGCFGGCRCTVGQVLQRAATATLGRTLLRGGGHAGRWRCCVSSRDFLGGGPHRGRCPRSLRALPCAGRRAGVFARHRVGTEGSSLLRGPADPERSAAVADAQPVAHKQERAGAHRHPPTSHPSVHEDRCRWLPAAGDIHHRCAPQLERLLADLSLVPSAVEEMLRYNSAIGIAPRVAREDVHLPQGMVREGRRSRSCSAPSTVTRPRLRTPTSSTSPEQKTRISRSGPAHTGASERLWPDSSSSLPSLRSCSAYQAFNSPRNLAGPASYRSVGSTHCASSGARHGEEEDLHLRLLAPGVRVTSHGP